MIAARQTPAINWKGVPVGMRNQYSAVCRSKAECEDLVRWFGDEDFCPFLPVLLLIPGALQQISGMGEATASEIRDQAVAVWEIITERMQKRGRPVDFDDLRDRAGLMRRENVDAAMREAMYDRIRRHKANPITDPARVPHYVRVNEKTVFAMGDAVMPKEESK